jgi:hypothetical protein
MLVSLENADLSALPPKANNPTAVLVSRESQWYLVNFILRQEIDKLRDILVSWEDTPSATLIIREQINAADGKSGYKPSALDMRILRIICRENIRCPEDYARWLENNFTY